MGPDFDKDSHYSSGIRSENLTSGSAFTRAAPVTVADPFALKVSSVDQDAVPGGPCRDPYRVLVPVPTRSPVGSDWDRVWDQVNIHFTKPVHHFVHFLKIFPSPDPNFPERIGKPGAEIKK